MDYKYRRFVKISFILFLSIFGLAAITFFALIFPHRTTPILMYHTLFGSGEEDSFIALDRDIFQKQMEYLSKHNYRVVSLRELVQRIKEGRKIPQNWVAITFDDGRKSFYDLAYPVLKKYKFNVTLFVILEAPGRDAKYLTWDSLIRIAKDGLVEIGSHSLYHLPLILLTPSDAKQEISGSKLLLEEKIGKKIAFFSYPYGATNKLIQQMVRESGYEAAVGLAYQRGEVSDGDIFCLKRIFVSKRSGHPLVFRFMLSGYYVPTRELILKVLNIRTPREVWSRRG